MPEHLGTHPGLVLGVRHPHPHAGAPIACASLLPASMDHDTTAVTCAQFRGAWEPSLHHEGDASRA
ncbi:hypothetical protein BD779DRAFT_1578866 [Infundibulicybe gibba]|nr:hypothetical protein BD779DRAFT_1578866 [Infundibulicybe gibba]